MSMCNTERAPWALAKVLKIYVPIPGKYNEKKNKLRKNWQLHDERFR